MTPLRYLYNCNFSDWICYSHVILLTEDMEKTYLFFLNINTVFLILKTQTPDLLVTFPDFGLALGKRAASSPAVGHID